MKGASSSEGVAQDQTQQSGGSRNHKPVTTPTPWLVAIKKPGKLRVCIDPRDLKKAILRPKISNVYS